MSEPVPVWIRSLDAAGTPEAMRLLYELKGSQDASHTEKQKLDALVFALADFKATPEEVRHAVQKYRLMCLASRDAQARYNAFRKKVGAP